MTVPRDLFLEKRGSNYWVRSLPIPELNSLTMQPRTFEEVDGRYLDLTREAGLLTGPAKLTLQGDTINSFSIILFNEKDQRLIIGYDKKTNQYFIDRRFSGNVAFEKGFAAKHVAPRLTDSSFFDLTLIIDNASVELFADNGLTVMTEIFFPDSIFSHLTLQSQDPFKLRKLGLVRMKSIFQTMPSR